MESIITNASLNKSSMFRDLLVLLFFGIGVLHAQDSILVSQNSFLKNMYFTIEPSIRTFNNSQYSNRDISPLLNIKLSQLNHYFKCEGGINVLYLPKKVYGDDVFLSFSAGLNILSFLPKSKTTNVKIYLGSTYYNQSYIEMSHDVHYIDTLNWPHSYPPPIFAELYTKKSKTEIFSFDVDLKYKLFSATFKLWNYKNNIRKIEDLFTNNHFFSLSYHHPLYNSKAKKHIVPQKTHTIYANIDLSFSLLSMEKASFYQRSLTYLYDKYLVFYPRIKFGGAYRYKNVLLSLNSQFFNKFNSFETNFSYNLQPLFGNSKSSFTGPFVGFYQLNDYNQGKLIVLGLDKTFSDLQMGVFHLTKYNMSMSASWNLFFTDRIISMDDTHVLQSFWELRIGYYLPVLKK